MGYRSEVTMLFYANNEEDLPLLKLWVDENLAPVLKEHWEQDEYQPREFERGQSKGYAVHFNDVKWYESYPEVQAVEETWDKFREMFNDDETTALGAERSQIGEDYGDVSYDNTYHSNNLLSIVRVAEY